MFDFLEDYDLLAAFWVTVKLTALSAVGSLIWGTMLAGMRVSPVPLMRAFGTAYVNVVRNTPLTVIIVFTSLGLFQTLSINMGSNEFETTNFRLAVLGFILYTSAFVCEALRSGINTVPVGQAEAARALGLSFTQVLTLIILPQAFRSVGLADIDDVFITHLQEHDGRRCDRCHRGRTADEGDDRERGPTAPDRGHLRTRIHVPHPSHRSDPRLGEQEGGGEAMTSVLYDAPGPRAKRRNILYSIVFLAALAAVIYWVYAKLDEKNQLDWVKWKPFFTDARSWETYIWPGLENTLTAAAFAMLIALPLGAIFGISRLSDHLSVRLPAGTVVEFFRAIPVLILMLFADAAYSEFTNVSSEDRPLYAVVTGLVLYNASVLAEIVRAGILSLPKGQSEAAVAIGMRKGQVMRSVLLPQSVTAMLPAIVSQLVVIVKDTALGGALLGFSELLASVRPMSANYGANTIASFTVVAVIFVVLNFALTSFASWLEGRLRRGKKSTGAVVGAAAVEDLATPGEHLSRDDLGGPGGPSST